MKKIIVILVMVSLGVIPFFTFCNDAQAASDPPNPPPNFNSTVGSLS